MRRTLLICLVLVFLAGSLIGTAAWSLFRAGPDQTTELVIDEGSSTIHVLEKLNDHGLLPHPSLGRIYLALFAHGRAPRFGHYRIPPGSRAVDALDQILSGEVMTLDVTVLEGTGVSEIAAKLGAAGIGTAEDWTRLTGDPRWVADLAPRASSLEGFLFPDTYRFAVGISAETAARHMVGRFRDVWKEETSTVEESWGTLFEVLTLASLVEAETSVPEERARIAGVFRNRLKRGMLLQCDPTVVFALKRRGQWQGRLLRVHWKLDDPYNTYLYAGLPPGPINSPGRAAIAAALKPEVHSFLYFVAKPGGGHTFSKNLKEHNRAVWLLRRSRR